MTQQMQPGGWPATRWRRVAVRELLAQAELGDERRVAVSVLLFQVRQQALARVDHLQQAAAAVVVFGVGLEVRREFIDARGEQRDLNFGAAGVGRAAGVGLDDFSRVGKGQGHGISWFFGKPSHASRLKSRCGRGFPG